MKKARSNINNDEMTVYDLSVLMMKQFERLEQKIDNNKDDSDQNFIIINTKISNIATDVEAIKSKVVKQEDKVNNVFYLGQEVRRLEKRVQKLEDK